jgi:tetratricopeptide (TPR) repeat protein
MAAGEGKPRAAERYAEESLAIYRELGDRQGASSVLNSVLGLAVAYTGDYERAKEYFRESLTIAREIGDRHGVAKGLSNLGYSARHQGKLQEAELYLEESLSLSREIGIQPMNALFDLASIQASTGQPETAWRTWREALAEAVAVGFASVIPASLGMAAGWLAQAGRYERAAELVGLARDRSVDVETQIESEPALAMLCQALSAEELKAAMARGRELDLDAVVAEMLAGEAG